MSRPESGMVGLNPVAIGISMSRQSWSSSVATWALGSRQSQVSWPMSRLGAPSDKAPNVRTTCDNVRLRARQRA